MTDHRKDAARLAAEGMYRPEFEGDACGVGLIGEISGKPSRRVVDAAIEALRSVWHRGAVDADGKTGDGAGLMLDLPTDFFAEAIRDSGHRVRERRLAVGMIFLPRADISAQDACRTIVEAELIAAGYTVYGWRQVPVDISVIGRKAQETRPGIEQVMIAGPREHEQSRAEFEKQLYLVRRRIERRIVAAQLRDFYICSLSCRSIVYKGLFLAESLTQFYPDLLDTRFTSRVAILHQRYSTNTFPQWWLAQPFRTMAHNGEINTIRGNKNWMRTHEIKMASLAFEGVERDIKPVIPVGASDTASLDAAIELLMRSGKEAPTAKSMLIPEVWENAPDMPEDVRAMYKYMASVMEPWDGPAALAMTDGQWAVAGLDRNALRPLAYARTDDGLLVVGSESGMVDLPSDRVAERGRLGPGEMIAIDLARGELLHDAALKRRIAAEAPYDELVGGFRTLSDLPDPPADSVELPADDVLARHQIAAGMSLEDMELILAPMGAEGKEAIGSMGDDTPLAVISNRPRLLSQFFRQNFAQVTNPPIDSLRERHVMSLRTRFANLANILEEDDQNDHVLVLESPILSSANWQRLRAGFGASQASIDCTYPADGTAEDLRAAIARIREEAEAAVGAGHSELFLTDEACGADRIGVPMILAAAAVHTHLTRVGLRSFTSVNVRSSECLDTHYCAVLIGVGATTVNPWVAEAALVDLHARGLLGEVSREQAIGNYRKALDDGLLKIMAKMGISVISSYRAGYNFEAVGLSRAITDDLFPGMPNKISGEGYASLHLNLTERHRAAYAKGSARLRIGGYYRQRDGEERHVWQARLMHLLQSACGTGKFELYRKFTQGLEAQPPFYLRDLLGFALPDEPLSLEAVEPTDAIRKRFVTPGMSLGALSPEAHETLSVAMNRIGAQAVSGEGGEAPERYHPRPDGDSANSAIKQIASGRFGVTAEYLRACEEIEIKIAQGAKPGEGGQLPGFKVNATIARLRHSTEGVTLISPPPHHDIYSIEDLAQLIYDLKQINPRARVCVKLVSAAGIGTVAAGVAKAHADTILISGHNGGTGASPQTSIKYAGTPWEMGLAEVHQVLALNGLRHRVKLRVDGGIKTGRDVVIGAILGAEEFGIGTMSLVAMGCIMVRQCHSNTCPVGVCTQDEALRAKFGGTPEKVVALMDFLARDVRETLARLGVAKLTDLVGRTELLRQVSRGAEHLDDLDLNPLLVKIPLEPGRNIFAIEEHRNPVPEGLDGAIVQDLGSRLPGGEAASLRYRVRNTHRAVGTRLSSAVLEHHGANGLPDATFDIELTGSAGQSLGAFLVPGIRLTVRGDANDYVGKGLSGGTIAVRSPEDANGSDRDDTLVGNTVLYGATSGRLHVAGRAGERFAVRNSGASAVIEGCGANGCEYMTGGDVVILGSTGRNFGAGMTGGMAFVWDRDGGFEGRANPESILWQRVASNYWAERLKDHLTRHVELTGSTRAANLLDRWDDALGEFWQVCPRDMIGRLEHELDDSTESEAA
ncbi:glutamate synthase large subunit [Pseudoblastomonas halimionae]|uniref:Glutamate synthase [NADPH] large chain n=1 Tax=Alteriqipengyuania halimionae TaxID=1926630 RepID=A0A6I4U3A2_9SPHN|nr:glutamate synthase large subunit [Alteriqipengyuania halimionae]MXP10549.1 glutamate synthase large subunit [Alteriqipengyuania halimionae]